MCEDAIDLLLGGMSTADVARAINRNVRDVKPVLPVLPCHSSKSQTIASGHSPERCSRLPPPLKQAIPPRKATAENKHSLTRPIWN
ncbi:unnamed protein product [Leuciscus chuanchicus]